MSSRTVSVSLFFVAGLICFIVAVNWRTTHVKIAFSYFSVICFCGLFFRWGLLIPVTLLAFFFGQSLPFKNGYSHGPMDNVVHDLIDPTLLATAVAVVLIVFDLAFARKQKSPTNDDRPA